MNLWNLGTEFMTKNLPLFMGETVMENRMMTDTLIPMVYQALDKFGAIDTSPEE